MNHIRAGGFLLRASDILRWALSLQYYRYRWFLLYIRVQTYSPLVDTRGFEPPIRPQRVGTLSCAPYGIRTHDLLRDREASTPDWTDGTEIINEPCKRYSGCNYICLLGQHWLCKYPSTVEYTLDTPLSLVIPGKRVDVLPCTDNQQKLHLLSVWLKLRDSGSSP